MKSLLGCAIRNVLTPAVPSLCHGRWQQMFFLNVSRLIDLRLGLRPYGPDSSRPERNRRRRRSGNN